MEFKHFLIENNITPTKGAQLIINQCLPYLNAIGGEIQEDYVLFRGTQHPKVSFSSQKRENTGTTGLASNYPQRIFNELQKVFHSKCKFNINQLVYGTTNPTVAKQFGHPHVIFPIGTFTFAYSKSGVTIPEIISSKNISGAMERANFICGVCDDTSHDGLPDPTFIHALEQADTIGHEILLSGGSFLPISLNYWNKHKQAIMEEISFSRF